MARESTFPKVLPIPISCLLLIGFLIMVGKTLHLKVLLSGARYEISRAKSAPNWYALMRSPSSSATLSAKKWTYPFFSFGISHLSRSTKLMSKANRHAWRHQLYLGLHPVPMGTAIKYTNHLLLELLIARSTKESGVSCAVHSRRQRRLHI